VADIKEKKEKIEFFDEEALMIYQKKQALETGLFCLKKAVRILKFWVQNPLHAYKLLKEHYQAIISLSEIPETHGALFDLFNAIF